MAISSSSLTPSLCFRTTFTRAGHSKMTTLLHQPTITGQFSSLSFHLFTKSRSRNPHLIMKSIQRGKDENTNQPSIELESESSSKTLESNSDSESDSVDDGLGTEIQEAMKAKKMKENEDKVLGSGGDFWSGVVEEIGMIEWPAFGKVLGTTGVVLGVIAGSSFVLLTVNAVLAELSDRVFVGREGYVPGAPSRIPAISTVR